MAAPQRLTDDAARQILRDKTMLLRAGVLKPEDVEDYMDHPEAWRHETASCRKLEEAMQRAGVDPAIGWGMTARELVQASVRRMG